MNIYKYLLDLDNELKKYMNNPSNIELYRKISKKLESLNDYGEFYFLKNFIWTGLTYEKIVAIESNINSKKENTNILYIIYSPLTKQVKIGRTSRNPNKRLKQIQGGCPDAVLLKTYDGYDFLEKKVHRLLKIFRVGGEWFNCTPEYAIKVIDKLISDNFDLV